MSDRCSEESKEEDEGEVICSKFGFKTLVPFFPRGAAPFDPRRQIQESASPPSIYQIEHRQDYIENKYVSLLSCQRGTCRADNSRGDGVRVGDEESDVRCKRVCVCGGGGGG